MAEPTTAPSPRQVAESVKKDEPKGTFNKVTSAYRFGPTVSLEEKDHLQSFLAQRGLQEVNEGQYTADYLLHIGFTEEELQAEAGNLTIYAEREEHVGPGQELVHDVLALFGKG
jgi:hypothetical protein